ncbi:Beta-lactamase class C and other penicillin binding protein [Minicystis rosea]|nr:Beta-lactamase class C and other penicillin binding protein [Minicystis rosea]
MESPAGEALDLTKIAAIAVDAHRAAPCAVVAAAVRTGGVVRRGLGAFGRLWPSDDAPAATVDTIFDLASVTKPVTALALARLARRGVLRRDEALADVVPELSATRSARVPMDLFAAHRAGLEAHLPLFAPLVDGGTVDPAAALRVAADARREGCDGDPPAGGFPPVYSDLGYMLLGASLAARGGDALDAVLAREVTEPLGLHIGSARQLRARAASAFDARVAPTEIVAFRGGMVRGAVHDENAWAIAGDAAAGHAGLFGDARSVLDLGLAVLDVLAGRRPSWLGPDDLAPLVQDRPGGSLLAGFDRRSGPTPLSGSRFGSRTFGHLGFTGTSLWIDPDAELVGVLLTNRVHPTRVGDAMRRARPAVYDALWDALRSAG